ncbi:MerR family transcriptional regulator [Levilactobacillus spicheri]|uniref:HTH merR-type domain-containing protein n=1 Tax=Levilactobacillus spicheri TaxID=216463 RepID=A0A0F3RSE3_9LACO|nr:MerR family transcriptional regulator [Levilactobacillus spicheri]KJW12795.1 hypothetical protein VC81_06850 [Levilactobacillus spicheri]
MQRYTSQQAADQVGMTPAAVRRYCAHGLVPEATERANGEWALTATSLARLRVVKACRLCGVSLPGIHAALVPQTQRPTATDVVGLRRLVEFGAVSRYHEGN